MNEFKPLAEGAGGQGRAVQVDPINATLRAPGTERLKLNYEELLSNFGFKFKLRRYNKELEKLSTMRVKDGDEPVTWVYDKVGRLQLDPVKP